MLPRRCPFCAEPIKPEALKCKHCKSMLPATAQVVSPRSSQGIPRWVLPVVAGVIVAAVTFALTSRSLLLGALVITLQPLAIAVVAVGRFASTAPPFARTASRFVLRHRWWSLGIAAALLAGAIPGVGVRRAAVAECEDARSHVLRLQKNGAGPDALAGPFDRAADACGEAGLEDERTEMAAASAEASAAAKRQEARDKERARQASYDAAIAAAREHAADPEQIGEAIDKFGEASRLGELSSEDRATYARLLRSDGERRIGEKRFGEGLERLEKAQAFAPYAEGLDELISKVKVEARAEQVSAWIERANAVSRDKTSCGIGERVSDAWAGLRQTTKDDRLYRQAAAAARRLERCRRRLLRDFTKAGRELRKVQRESWAREYETKLLDEGMDVRVRLRGRYRDTIKIVYVLFNRAWAHKITGGGSTAPGSVLGNLENLGFKRVVFSDGYFESYSYSLDPEDETTMGELTLREMGLGEPLEL
jgi:hypothetical protein